MTTAELARHNLVRLVTASGRKPEDIAIRAWPLPERVTASRWRVDVEQRRRKLARYLGELLRNGKPVTIPLEEIGNLAAALEVDAAEFFREPTN
jgi:hypothetical protein